MYDQQRIIKEKEKKKTQREEEEKEEEGSFKAPQGSIIPAIEMTPWVPRRRP